MHHLSAISLQEPTTQAGRWQRQAGHFGTAVVSTYERMQVRCISPACLHDFGHATCPSPPLQMQHSAMLTRQVKKPLSADQVAFAEEFVNKRHILYFSLNQNDT